MYLKGSEMVVSIRDSIKTVIDTYEINLITIEDLNGLKNDLVHEIEWSNCNAADGYKLYRELQNTLRERRYRKNENDSLKPLYDFLKPKQKAVDQLSQCVGECRKNDDALNRRTYHPRVKTNMKEKVNSIMKTVVNF